MPSDKKRYIQVENKNALLELLLSDVALEKIFVASNAFRDPKTKKIISEAHARNIPVERVTRRHINRLSRSKTCESVIGLKPAPEQKKLEDILDRDRNVSSEKKRTSKDTRKPLFFLILNEIHYKQNIGALLRTAYGSGVDAVIISKKKSTFLTEEVTRISMGASERVPIIQMNVFDAIKKLKDAGVRIVGVHMDGRPYYETDIKGDAAIIVGSEDKGISPRLLDRCDVIASIPMEAGLGSLNVSVAGAIIMFEKVRQDSMK
jgi:23S rRNA (guanosine2251-2'-O)-methyltransferase